MVTATAYIVQQEGGKFKRKQVELDALQEGKVLVELQATGVCHTDIAVQLGKIPVPLPAVLGHEGSKWHSCGKTLY